MPEFVPEPLPFRDAERSLAVPLSEIWIRQVLPLMPNVCVCVLYDMEIWELCHLCFRAKLLEIPKIPL